MTIEEIEELIAKNGSITAQPLMDLIVTVVLEAVEAEREACAKVCDETEETCWETWDWMADPIDQGSAIGAAHCAAAIRNRGNA
jgi:hypothetical protein